jgi:hypothetical protein
MLGMQPFQRSESASYLTVVQPDASFEEGKGDHEGNDPGPPVGTVPQEHEHQQGGHTNQHSCGDIRPPSRVVGRAERCQQGDPEAGGQKQQQSQAVGGAGNHFDLADPDLLRGEVEALVEAVVAGADAPVEEQCAQWHQRVEEVEGADQPVERAASGAAFRLLAVHEMSLVCAMRTLLACWREGAAGVRSDVRYRWRSTA